MNTYALSVDYKEQKEWNKAPMWLEMAIGAVAGGLFIASLIFKFALGAVVALLAMLIGKGALLLADLGKPERFLKVLKRPKQSWISKGAWGFMLFAVAGVASVAPLVIPSLSWTPWGGAGKILGIAAGALAAFMMIYDGFFLADSKGVTFWNNGNLPILFGANATVGGIGALMVLAPMGGLVVSSGTLAVANTVALGVAGLTLYSYMKSAANGEGGAQLSAEKLTKGELSNVFWKGTVAAGIAVPLVVSVLALMGVNLPVLIWALTGVLEITGVVALRYSVLNAGVYSPVI
ncbi:MAG: NrfD/PsrC family molybdoenzyme membrane anchor subunit [Desulfitobacterium sp.]